MILLARSTLMNGLMSDGFSQSIPLYTVHKTYIYQSCCKFLTGYVKKFDYSMIQLIQLHRNAAFDLSFLKC